MRYTLIKLDGYHVAESCDDCGVVGVGQTPRDAVLDLLDAWEEATGERVAEAEAEEG